MTLAEQLRKYRTIFPVKVTDPAGDAAGDAVEIISDHTGRDEPIWEGFWVTSSGSNTELNTPVETHFKTAIHELRATSNCTTHWSIASDDKGVVPRFFKVEGTINSADVSELDWTKEKWVELKDRVGIDLSKLHRKALWKGFFDTEQFAKDDVKYLSLVYCFKAGRTVMGIWAFHAQGTPWQQAIHTILEPSDGLNKVLRLIKPAIICLTESLAQKYERCDQARWDLACLAHNSLRRHPNPMGVATFQRRICGQTSGLWAKLDEVVRALVIRSPTIHHYGRETDYGDVFDKVIATVESRRMTERNLKPVSCSQSVKDRLKRIYVGWHLTVRSVSENPADDSALKAARKLILEGVGGQAVDVQSHLSESIFGVLERRECDSFWEQACLPLFNGKGWCESSTTGDQKKVFLEELKRIIFFESQ